MDIYRWPKSFIVVLLGGSYAPWGTCMHWSKSHFILIDAGHYSKCCQCFVFTLLSSFISDLLKNLPGGLTSLRKGFLCLETGFLFFKIFIICSWLLLMIEPLVLEWNFFLYVYSLKKHNASLRYNFSIFSCGYLYAICFGLLRAGAS